jgi:general secretion pathway protein L
MSQRQLRIILPPLAELDADSRVTFVWLDREGRQHSQGESRLRELAAGAYTAVECALHPQDSLLASIELPPLPAARLGAAVTYAAQGLILGASEQFYIAHGPRESDGQVLVTWLERSALERLQQLLDGCRLKLKGLFAAPYFLPVPAVGEDSDGQWQEHRLLRGGVHQARVEPLLQATAGPLTPDWTGVTPGWGLHQCLQRHRPAQRGWGLALGCWGLAALVWLVGLNLYAARLAAQGNALKTQMTQQVRAAFPALTVVLNPLQQVRQQLAVGASGAMDDPTQRFPVLLQQAGKRMPFIAGAVQALVFSNGELHLTLVAGHKPPVDAAWQTELVQLGIEAVPVADGWTLRANSTGAQDALAAGAADE